MKLETLPADIYNLLGPDTDHVASEENLNDFANGLKDLLRTRLAKRPTPNTPLRFSALGKQDRQIWYAANHYPQEEMQPNTYLKFLYGDVIEALVLFLAKESGHSVEMEQHEVVVDDVTGHIDAIIDGVVIDVKSASPFGFKKFEEGITKETDSFGYIPQLSGYANILSPGADAAFVAVDKVSGDIVVSEVSAATIKDNPPAERIAHLKEVINRVDPPPRCFEPIPDGKSGNMKLPTQCSYCAFKFSCHPTVRTFIFSTGPRYLTTVERIPNVFEVTE